MSVLDFYDDQFLPGDRSPRTLKTEVIDYNQFPGEKGSEEIFIKKTGFLWLPYLICLIIFFILFTTLIKLQVSQGSFNRILAEGNRVRLRQVNAPRGLISDSKGKVLAQNIANFDLEIFPLDLPKTKKDRQDVYERLAAVTGISADEIRSKVEKIEKEKYKISNSAVLKENLDRETAMLLEVKTAGLAGVQVTKNSVRQYETINGLGAILGYVGKVSEKDLEANPNYKRSDEIGKEGLESVYEKFLKGNPGVLSIEVDSQGREQRELSVTQPTPGNNLVLNINADLEDEISKSLGNILAASKKGTGGSVVAMNPKTGEILAMVSLPSYDNNLFRRESATEEYQKLLDDPGNPLFNRAIAGTYPSGSIIKPMMSAMSLEEGQITAVTTITDPGEIKVGNWTYPDWKAHGRVDVRKAIAESCDVFFYAVAGGWDKIKGLGIDKIDQYLFKFGFGKKTGIDLPGEVTGLVPNPDWKKRVKKESWYLGDTYHVGIGQGDLLVTPLQMVMATSAIANGGQVLKPMLVNKIVDQNDQVIKKFDKDVLNEKFISEANIRIVQEGMRQAVISGSAKSLSDLPVSVAAKTGTAQFEVAGKTHAWMTAYAPYDDPQIAVVVLVEQGGEGYAEAGPVVHDILRWYFKK